MCFCSFSTDVSSDLLEQLQQLKQEVDALAAAREKVKGRYSFERVVVGLT